MFHKTIPDTTPTYERKWDGGLFDFHGRAARCDGQAWDAICLTCWCPCVVFGLNMRRAFKESAWLHAVAFFVLFNCVPVAGFTTFVVAVSRLAVTSSQSPESTASYFDSVKNIMYFYLYSCGILGILYGVAMRLRIIKKYRIKESGCTTFCYWWCCRPCAICQERRTLLTHVDEQTGLWSENPPSWSEPLIQATQLATTYPPVPANMDADSAV